MWYTKSDVMRKLRLHLAQTFCEGLDRETRAAGTGRIGGASTGLGGRIDCVITGLTLAR